jgi:hypothetical protein
VLFVLVMVFATALTLWGTFYVLKTFVIGSPNDPLTRAGGISSSQEREGKGASSLFPLPWSKLDDDKMRALAIAGATANRLKIILRKSMQRRIPSEVNRTDCRGSSSKERAERSQGAPLPKPGDGQS